MRSANLMRITLAALLGVALVTPLAAQQQAAKHHKYKLIDLGTFGGPHSSFNSGSRIINRSGTTVGGASTSLLTPCAFSISPTASSFTRAGTRRAYFPTSVR